MLKIRQGIPKATRLKKSAAIMAKLVRLSLFQKADDIFLYYSFKNEVETHSFIDQFYKDKNIFLPRIQGEHMEPVLFQGSAFLKPGYAKILEPIEMPAKKEVSSQNIELIIIPGVAFDRCGTRLGFGKGYYDNYLKRHKKIPKIGLAFQEQMVDYIPRDPYDIPVDLIITDVDIHSCNPELRLS